MCDESNESSSSIEAKQPPAADATGTRVEVEPGLTLEEWAERFTIEMEQWEAELDKSHRRMWTPFRLFGLEVG